MISASTKRECATSRFLTHLTDAFRHIPNVYGQIVRGYVIRGKTERSRMEHIPTVISAAALIVAFVALALNKRSGELPKEKKTRKKRQPKEVTQEA
jgi:hypothetical protein